MPYWAPIISAPSRHQRVLQAGNLMQTDQLLAGVASCSSVFGLVVGKVIGWLETQLHWR